MTGADPADEFQKSFPNLPVDECLKRSIREFHVPMDGTAYSPKMSHVLSEAFVFEEMCPQLFAGIRRLSQVSNEEYFDSLCRTDFEFIAFGSNSKSGEVFFFSHDKKFLLKTTTEIEASTLMSMLAEYESHLAAVPFSFLGRYLGLYRLKIPGSTSSKLFFVMRSVSDPDSGQAITKSFDIKGSTRHRLAPESDSVGKDLNFDKEVGQLDLQPEVAAQIVATHKADCELLRKYSIMDFSFLIQIHDAEGKSASTNELKSEATQSSVKLKEETTKRVRWFNPTESVFTGLDLVAKVNDIQLHMGTEKMDEDVKWRPNKGIRSPDGRHTYFFGLIDMLVPFGWYPKAQYAGTHVISCIKCSCDANGTSRIPPNRYCTRQVAKVTKLCGL
eukprot:gnl/MRDRNA2_/MRDRNA2_28918_c0_seq2.p1 gnl/MRDRNA2_/MRDRNA2_28918_c0~~gnl/MRDRNA2_/MRDRNA2_28918_c0_seq2.p1  ORF type:complete len:437 (-),score=58.58 gnl/MRDRNA2_/MRDRNA2_28918_c0_seq2:291-1451(-)